MIQRPLNISKKEKISFFDLKNNKKYKDSLIDALTRNISDIDKSELKKLINYTIDNSELFNRDELSGCLYDGEDDILDLILPSISRLYSKIYIKPPQIFVNSYDDGLRLKLFRLRFDIDNFLNYLIEMLIKSKDTLKHFDKIDRTSETLSLIIDNYIAGLVESVLESYDIKEEIKRIERDKKLKLLI